METNFYGIRKLGDKYQIVHRIVEGKDNYLYYSSINLFYKKKSFAEKQSHVFMKKLYPNSKISFFGDISERIRT